MSMRKGRNCEQFWVSRDDRLEAFNPSWEPSGKSQQNCCRLLAHPPDQLCRQYSKPAICPTARAVRPDVGRHKGKAGGDLILRGLYSLMLLSVYWCLRSFGQRGLHCYVDRSCGAVCLDS